MPQGNDTLNQIAPYLNLTEPYMVLLVYAAAGVLVIAVLAFFTRVLSGVGNGLLRFTSRLLILLGIVFLIYQGLNTLAGTGLTTKFASFWTVALVLLIPGIVFRLIGALRPTRE